MSRQDRFVFPIWPTRNETDFAHHITDLIAQDPKAGLILIVDQLNTHQSESLVRLVATQCPLRGLRHQGHWALNQWLPVLLSQ